MLASNKKNVKTQFNNIVHMSISQKMSYIQNKKNDQIYRPENNKTVHNKMMLTQVSTATRNLKCMSNTLFIS